MREGYCGVPYDVVGVLAVVGTHHMSCVLLEFMALFLFVVVVVVRLLVSAVDAALL